MDRDPPVFMVGFTGQAERPEDTMRTLMEIRECTLQVVLEHFIEAANTCSLDAPHRVSNGLCLVCIKRRAQPSNLPEFASQSFR